MFKKYLLVSVTCVMSMISGVSSANEPFPSQAIKWIVPSSPGSAFDNVARVLEPALTKKFGQSVVVHNLAGASNMTGTKEVARAKPDGYTVGMISSTHAINPYLHDNIPFDAVKDFTPITNLVITPLIVTVPANSPYKTLQDLIKDAKANPDKITYGSAGVGNSLHLATVLLENKTGIKMTHAPYKGGNLIVTDLIAGHLDMATMAIPSILEQVKAGTLRALATTTNKRSDALPDVPTIEETGVKGYNYSTWLALVGPKDLPTDIRDKWNATIKEVMADPEIQAKIKGLGLSIETSTPDELAARIQQDLQENKTLLEPILKK